MAIQQQELLKSMATLTVRWQSLRNNLNRTHDYTGVPSAGIRLDENRDGGTGILAGGSLTLGCGSGG